MTRTRAWRRWQRERIKNKRKDYWLVKYFWWPDESSDEEYAFRLGRAIKTPKPCSCWMCGHRRRSEGVTVQERRAMQ